jgi:UDP-N-acetylmuramyl pentapeptide phosphotransferase/UDP-N-acetylglucosamine-1-phosphate transferase
VILAIANYFFTGWFIRYAKVKRITDVPTERSSHTTPTPRGGGVGLVIFTLFGLVLYAGWRGWLLEPETLALIGSSAMMGLLGWSDDKQDLSSTARLSVHVIASVIVIVLIGQLSVFYIPWLIESPVGITGMFLTLLWLTGVTNIYNFMDGVDGIASVQALSASAGWMVLAYFWQEPLLLVINMILFATVSAFLLHNWSPAKIFMGDVGSVFLGFFYGVMPFLASNISIQLSVGEGIWVAAIFLWPFLFDGAFTLIRRFFRGENVFEAHKSHLYQRLNVNGWKHNSISILYLTFSVISAITAVTFYYSGEVTRAMLIIILFLLSFLYAQIVEMLERKSRKVG